MDKIILVDIFDRQTGAAEKLEAHRKPLLHRAFSVFIHHEGKMLIQKRAAHKYHSGGLWANACCSHPRCGERLEDAVTRRLREEAGISAANVTEAFSFVYLNKFNDELYEYEYDHVFISDYAGELNPNKDEAEEFRWVDFDELAALLRTSPERFAAWFLIAAPRVLAELKIAE